MLEPSSGAARAVQVMTWVVLVLPWVSPWTSGPSPNVQPWLTAAACAALFVVLQGATRPSWPLPMWLGAAVLAAAGAGLGPWPEGLALLGGLAIVIGTAAVAAGPDRAGLVRLIAVAWLSAAILSSVVALGQYFGWTATLAPWVSGAQIGEAYGNLRQRNQLASLTAIGLAALLWLVRGGASFRLSAMAALPLAFAAAATASRTGLLQWLMLAAVAIAVPGPRRRTVAGAATFGLLAYGAAAVALPQALAAMGHARGPDIFTRLVADLGCSSRTVLWNNVLHLVAQRPWTGWGWGELDYAHYLTLYEGPRFCDILDNAHNLPLHLAVELGIPVALVVSAAALWSLARAGASMRTGEGGQELGLAVTIVILLHSLVEYPLWYGGFQMALGLSFGLLWPGRRTADHEVRPPPAWPRAVAVALLGAVGYVAWDYHRVSQIYLPPEARARQYRDDPLPELRNSILFQTQVRFAELTLTPLTRANAAWTFQEASALLHYSPEPRVIEKLIESALLLRREDEVVTHLRRFRAAFPKDHAAWAREHGWIAASGSLRD